MLDLTDGSGRQGRPAMGRVIAIVNQKGGVG